jgi:MFS family permease
MTLSSGNVVDRRAANGCIAPHSTMNNNQNKLLFWGCFIALITTSYAFISRMILCGGQFVTDFGLDKVAVGELQGAGIWPFGVSIILFSLFIDRIGYKVAMIFSFVSYLVYTAMAIAAYAAIQGATGEALVAAQAKGVKLLMWGSIILGLGNGAVEAYINPVVATLFNKDKVKWLNILHAGWPAGLVLGGLTTIALAGNTDWRITLGLILVPAVIFFVMLIGKQFPKSEREQAGIGYVAMLKELGVFGAFVGFGLVFAQLRSGVRLVAYRELDFDRGRGARFCGDHQILWPPDSRVSHHHHDAAGHDRIGNGWLDQFVDGDAHASAGT